MLFLFSHISTWLFIEIIATLLLAILNMIIPALMMFTSYRNLVNFYFSSTALSSSLINFLYLFYLIQTIRSKVLSEINCRAIYYLQTSCIFVLAYTIAAMHANFVLYLFPSSSSDQHHLIHRCWRSFNRWFRRLCFCFVLLVWSISFTSTIPLLYTIDSNEKSPKPVYCPGTTQITYLEEWLDRSRFKQTIIFYLIPLLISLFLSLIALSKLFYDCLVYFYSRLKISQCSPCRKKSSSSNVTIQSYGRWFLTSFLRFIFVLSSCLLACIYPIVMRFYLVYFSVFVPLIFAVFNYSLGQLASTQQQPIIENRNMSLTTSLTVGQNSSNMNSSKIFETNEQNNSSNEQLELRSSLMTNILNKHDQSSSIPSSSSTIKGKRKYFANHLYENTQNMFTR